MHAEFQDRFPSSCEALSQWINLIPKNAQLWLCIFLNLFDLDLNTVKSWRKGETFFFSSISFVSFIPHSNNFIYPLDYIF